MPKIKHIALSTQDVDGTAKFYIDVFGMKEIAKIDGPGARGYYLSDGDLNLAILNFKNDAVAGVERGTGWSGIHHIGFQVESLEEITEKLAAAGSKPRDDINQALGVGHGPPSRRQRRGEVQRPRQRDGRRLGNRLGRHLRTVLRRGASKGPPIPPDARGAPAQPWRPSILRLLWQLRTTLRARVTAGAPSDLTPCLATLPTWPPTVGADSSVSAL